MAKGKTKRGSLKSFAVAVQYIENNKVSNIIMAIALVLFGWQTVKNNERVILVPPNMAEEMVKDMVEDMEIVDISVDMCIFFLLYLRLCCNDTHVRMHARTNTQLPRI